MTEYEHEARSAVNSQGGQTRTDGAPSALEALVKRDRQIVVAGLITVIALSWTYILSGAGMGMNAIEMSPTPVPGALGGMGERMVMTQTAVLQPAVWTPGYALHMFVMWWVMMVAMMLPSAAPMILLFAQVNRARQAKGRPYAPTGIFAAGYLVAWGGFSVVAAGFQWELDSVRLLSPMMASTSPMFAGIVLLAAGVYQFTPLKHACLTYCRNPFHFVMTYWRDGKLGALLMGLNHGAYCLACCWFLMGLLFVGGVMNLYWIIGVTAFVLLEKTIPAGHWFGMCIGIALIVLGVLVLVYF